MQDAATILRIMHELGAKGRPLDRIYRQLFNRNLYLRAYGKIYCNAGAMTPGVTAETVDGMSQRKIDAIIEAVRYERYRWSPVRRVLIEKKGSTKKRPLGVPTWSDKLLAEVVREILEAFYEPQFSRHSHGFRPGRGCHTALEEIHREWRGTAWFIEGDISDCFGSFDHTVMLSILAERIHDNRFLRLIKGMLKAGYLEDWVYHKTLSGSPQGGVASPVLSNIYLDKLDRFIETVVRPAYTKGDHREPNPVYVALRTRGYTLRKKGLTKAARCIKTLMHTLPSQDTHDPEFRRLRYVRYADDWLIGFTGPREEAEAIKRQIGEFLRDELKLTLSDQKTLITHGRSQRAHFLGYDLKVIHNDTLHDQTGRRTSNGVIGLLVPEVVVRAKKAAYTKRGKPVHRLARTPNSAYSTVAQYQQEFRGLAEYYALAHNRDRLSELRFVMEQSLTKTLAHKLKVSVSQVYKRFQATLSTERGPRTGLAVTVERPGKKPLVARWGGISLIRQEKAVLNDAPAKIWNDRTEVVERLLADTCEACGSQVNVEVHHVRALNDLEKPGRDKPAWATVMIARRRKTLVLCSTCHHYLHTGRPITFTQQRC
jgi:group II intron reverse transcriptase/maturase